MASSLVTPSPVKAFPPHAILGQAESIEDRNRERVKAGILSDFEFLVTFSEEASNPWGLVRRDDLEIDPPGVVANARMHKSLRKQRMTLKFAGSGFIKKCFVFSRVESGKYTLRSFSIIVMYNVDSWLQATPFTT